MLMWQRIDNFGQVNYLSVLAINPAQPANLLVCGGISPDTNKYTHTSLSFKRKHIIDYYDYIFQAEATSEKSNI